MSTRWMAVQYLGNTLRLPVVNESDMGKPFGSSTLEREVKRIVVNPFSDSPQAFVPEDENAKMSEFDADMWESFRRGGPWVAHSEYMRVVAENAKLRELVHILCHCMNLHAKCDDCRLNGSKGELTHDHLCACDGLYKILRELEVEVDE